MPLNAGRARVARCGRSAELTISSWWDRAIRDLLAKVKVTGFAESESHVEGDDALLLWASDGVRAGSDTFVDRQGADATLARY